MSDKSSELVKATQMMLVMGGYLRAPHGVDPVDGLLGTDTLNALERFHHDQFLKGQQWTAEELAKAQVDRPAVVAMESIAATGPVVARGQERIPPVELGTFSLHGLQAAVDARAFHIDKGGQLGGLFFATEFAGEAGEACNIVKKIERERLGIPGRRSDPKRLGSELADTIITACNLARCYGINLHEAIVETFNATSAERELPVMLK